MKITIVRASLVDGSGIKEENIYEEWKEILNPILQDAIDGNLKLETTGKELVLSLFGDDVRPPIRNVSVYVSHNNKNYRLGFGNNENSEVYFEEI